MYFSIHIFAYFFKCLLSTQITGMITLLNLDDCAIKHAIFHCLCEQLHKCATLAFPIWTRVASGAAVACEICKLSSGKAIKKKFSLQSIWVSMWQQFTNTSTGRDRLTPGSFAYEKANYHVPSFTSDSRHICRIMYLSLACSNHHIISVFADGRLDNFRKADLK